MTVKMTWAEYLKQKREGKVGPAHDKVTKKAEEKPKKRKKKDDDE